MQWRRSFISTSLNQKSLGVTGDLSTFQRNVILTSEDDAGESFTSWKEGQVKNKDNDDISEYESTRQQKTLTSFAFSIFFLVMERL